MNVSRSLCTALLGLALGACCFGGAHGAADTGPAAFDPASAGQGQLPTPPPLFAGVDPPYPNPLAARGTEGAIVRSGTATVQTISGNLPGVAVGTVCSYTEFVHVGTTVDCRWNLTCAGFVLYGLGTGGYGRCEDPSWSAGVLALDTRNSSAEYHGDPSFVFNGTTISVSDDVGGRLGAFTVTLGVP
jgi:hypothetical protein